MKYLIVVVLLVSSAQLVCAQSETQEIQRKRFALEQKFEELCEQKFDYFRRSPHQSLLFLKNKQFDSSGIKEHEKYAKLLSSKLLLLANRAVLADDATLAYDLLHEACFFGDETADKVIGQEASEPRVALAKATHSHLRWKRKTYYLIANDHFQVATKNEAEGIRLADQLEQLHTMWSQLFFTHWSDTRRLKKSIAQSSPLVPRSHSRRHKVVLFPDRDAYIAFLAPRQPRIEITLGFYDPATKTSYFFAGGESSASTQLHEVTHQLFQEVTKTSRRESFANNFWAVEGVAMYMESMFLAGPVGVVGGLHANRLQYARFRRLQEGFYVPVAELTSLGRHRLQRDKRIRKIYSQAAGLTHFLMDGAGGSMRKDYVDFLRTVYEGKSQPDALRQKMRNLDQDYEAYLRAGTAEFANSWLPKDGIKSLCMGTLDVDDKLLSKLGSQSKLEWLDLARTSITDQGLSNLNATRSLIQLTLDGASITDTSMAWVGLNLGLEELDLSNTAVTPSGIQQLGKLAKLQTLWLSNTAVTDEIVPVVLQLKSLEFLAVDGTRVSDAAKQKLIAAMPGLKIQ